MGKKIVEFDGRVTEYVDSRKNYGHKLSKQDLEWLIKFEREYYANDHSKPNSIHKEVFKENYDKVSSKYKNSSNKDTALKNSMFIQYNSRMFDIISNMRSGKLDVKLACNPIEDFSMFIEDNAVKEDKTLVSSLLKHYSFKEILDLLIEDIIEQSENDSLTKASIRTILSKVIVLAFTAKSRYYKNNLNKKKLKTPKNV